MTERTVQHETNRFCRARGFKAKDLGNHPCADDLVILTLIKQELRAYTNNKDHAKVESLWNMVYNKHFPLKNKHRQALEEIIIRAQKAIALRQHQRQRIQQLKAQV